MATIIDIALLAFLVITAVAMIRLRNLVIVVVLGGIFSFLMASLFVVMDAVDVAFTEAAVGAGVSTILLLATLRLVGTEEKVSSHTPFIPLLVCVITGAVLLYASLDMPDFGDPNSPVQTHVGPHYLGESPHEIGPIPNVVTSILASYRGFDTLGEVVVVFTAGAACVLLIGGRRRKEDEDADKAGKDQGDAA